MWALKWYLSDVWNKAFFAVVSINAHFGRWRCFVFIVHKVLMSVLMWFWLLFFKNNMHWIFWPVLAAPERPGSGIPGQIPAASSGDPGVCAGKHQEKDWGRRAGGSALFLLHAGETHAERRTVWRRHGGGEERLMLEAFRISSHSTFTFLHFQTRHF